MQGNLRQIVFPSLSERSLGEIEGRDLFLVEVVTVIPVRMLLSLTFTPVIVKIAITTAMLPSLIHQLKLSSVLTLYSRVDRDDFGVEDQYKESSTKVARHFTLQKVKFSTWRHFRMIEGLDYHKLAFRLPQKEASV